MVTFILVALMILAPMEATLCERQMDQIRRQALSGPLVPEDRVACVAIHCIEEDGSLFADDTFCWTREDQVRHQSTRRRPTLRAERQ